MKITRGIIFVLLLTWCLPALSSAESGEQQFKTLITETIGVARTPLYTAYNLYADHGQINAINFRVGNIIPAGTPVKVKFTEEFESPITATGNMILSITITTLPDQKNYTLKFNSRYHPGKSIFDYANMMLSTKTFEEMTAGKPAEVVEAIRRSAVIEGMTKEEVILSYGYPAEHVTPSLRDSSWIYWKNRFGKKKICFNAEELAISCEKVTNQDL